MYLPSGHYEVSFHHIISGSLHPAVNTLGLEYIGSNFTVDAQIVALAWGQKIVSTLSANVVFKNVIFRVQDGSVLELAQDVAGGKAGPMAPPNTAILVHKHTSSPGRKNRGRMYLAGMTEADVNDLGGLAGSKITEMNNALNNFVSQIGGANWQPKIIHKAAPDFPTFITSMTVDPTVGSQRRRLR